MVDPAEHPPSEPTREHFCSHRFLDVDFDPGHSYSQLPCPKPKGLWYSIDGDWERWCREEEMNFEWYRRWTIDISGSNILRLSKEADLRSFTSRFAFDENEESWISHDIDWLVVASRWDGIEIAPYIWECRLDIQTSWYYGWDCASGCIWNLSSIKVAETLSEEPSRA